MKTRDLSGKRFGRLVALCPTNDRKRRTVVWACRCDCGKYIDACVHELAHGHKSSCGCAKLEVRRPIEYKGEFYSVKEFAEKFGLKETTVVNRWRNGWRGEDLAKGRPRPKHRPSQCKYKDEDGTPISFTQLSEELGISRWGLMLRYKAGDRGEELRRPITPPENRQDYCKKKLGKTPILIMFKGTKTTISELSKMFDLPVGVIYYRHKKGLVDDDLVKPRKSAVKKPKKPNRRKPVYKDSSGRTYTFNELSEKTGISVQTLKSRWLRGCRKDALIALTPRERRKQEAVNE